MENALGVIQSTHPCGVRQSSLPRLWPHWFSRSSKYPTGDQKSITGPRLCVKGPSLMCDQGSMHQTSYHYYITVITGMQVKHEPDN